MLDWLDHFWVRITTITKVTVKYKGYKGLKWKQSVCDLFNDNHLVDKYYIFL